jgi:hypothetical protein
MENIESLKNKLLEKFATVETKKDLAQYLTEVKYELYGKETTTPVYLKSLTYYSNYELCKNRYKTFTIKKKSGSERIIHAPVNELKSILRILNYVLQICFTPHKSATGFVLEKSIVDNANRHINQNYVLNIDLKDFFYSFDRNRVKRCFMQEPFNLTNEREPLAFLLACLVTHPLPVDEGIKIVLPQGSPTSPTITNILCYKLDVRLNGLAKRFGVRYSRYADDISFSSNHNVFNNDEFNNELRRIIEQYQQLRINSKKTRLQKAGYKQMVTGLVVNEKVNVEKSYVKRIRMWLYYWEKYGYEKANQIFKRDYISEKGHVKNVNAQLINVLDGKLEFLKMVRGLEDKTYNGLKSRFEELTGSRSSLNHIINIWEKSGIDQAMELYYKDKN